MNEEVFDENGTKIGIIKSTNKSIGLAKIKFESVLNSKILKTKNGKNLKFVQPFWKNFEQEK